jgi:hypothetical protein
MSPAKGEEAIWFSTFNRIASSRLLAMTPSAREGEKRERN